MENTECYKCGNKGHFARDCFSKTSKPSYQSPVNNYSSVSKGFQPKFTPKLIQSSPNSSSQADPKFQKYYKAEYKKMKAKLALLEASPSSSQNPKTFQPKNKGLVTETFDWDEEEVSNDEEVTRVKLNHALQEQLKVEKKINEKWLTSSKKVSQCISEQIPHQKKKIIGCKLLTKSLSRMNINENAFILASMDYDHEMVPKSKDWVKRLNPDSRTHHSSTSPEYPLGSFTKLKGNVIDLSSLLPKRETRLRILYYMICKREDHRTLDHEIYIALLKRSENYKAQPYKYASHSKQILKAKAKPFPPCTQCGFNDYRPDDCRNYPECEIYRSYDHFTSRHNHVIQIRGGVLAESS
ncbi:retrovirus-related pol polyprotein from transposon TNT 1-94 [Tanacetum coccineum]